MEKKCLKFMLGIMILCSIILISVSSFADCPDDIITVNAKVYNLTNPSYEEFVWSLSLPEIPSISSDKYKAKVDKLLLALYEDYEIESEIVDHSTKVETCTYKKMRDFIKGGKLINNNDGKPNNEDLQFAIDDDDGDFYVSQNFIDWLNNFEYKQILSTGKIQIPNYLYTTGYGYGGFDEKDYTPKSHNEIRIYIDYYFKEEAKKELKYELNSLRALVGGTPSHDDLERSFVELFFLIDLLEEYENNGIVKINDSGITIDFSKLDFDEIESKIDKKVSSSGSFELVEKDCYCHDKPKYLIQAELRPKNITTVVRNYKLYDDPKDTTYNKDFSDILKDVPQSIAQDKNALSDYAQAKLKERYESKFYTIKLLSVVPLSAENTEASVSFEVHRNPQECPETPVCPEIKNKPIKDESERNYWIHYPGQTSSRETFKLSEEKSSKSLKSVPHSLPATGNREIFPVYIFAGLMLFTAFSLKQS